MYYSETISFLDPDYDSGRWQCSCCGEWQDKDFGGVADEQECCSYRCWYRLDRRFFRNWVLRVIENSKTVDEVIETIDDEWITLSTIERFRRVIEYRINKNAANSAVTLKAA